MNTILIFFACYVAFAVGINAIAIGYRRELAESVHKARQIEGLDDREIAILDSFLLSMRSLRTAVILSLVFAQILLTPNERLKASTEMSKNDETLFDAGLMPRILELHLASAAAANPIFGAVAYFLRLMVHIRFAALLGPDRERGELHTVAARYAAC